MPEIKHNFTTGKMNKDLDERLVQNGEYRHATNIQVSTSDDSDVGSVQNILGNSLIENLEYLPNNTTCLGSIADEKNDKIYWFLLGDTLDATDLVNGNYEDTTTTVYTQTDWDTFGETGIVTQDEWTLVADGPVTQLGHGMSIDAIDGVLKRDNSNLGTNSSARQKVDVINGVEYTVSYDRKYTGGASTETNIFMDFGNGNQGLAISTENSGSFVTVTDTFTAAFTGEMFFRIYFIGDMEGEIDNVTISTSAKTSRILEYDKANDEINPVFVDIDNSVLKFSENKITAINIIDDLLFFTDGINEPKKINIQRSKDNTTDGNSFTTITDYSNTSFPAKEEHITVIKKAPINAPTIQYNYFRDPSKANTGIISISDTYAPGPHTLINSSKGLINDFATLSVGDTFQTIIETDINFINEFVLNWQNGTNVILKAFDDNGNPPIVPLQNYDIKGFITNWSNNEFVNTNELYDFENVSNQTNWQVVTQDETYSFDNTDPASADNQKLVFYTHDGVDGNEILDNRNYEISFELETFGGNLQGDLKVFLFNNTTGTNQYVEVDELTNLANTNTGVYTYTIDPNVYNLNAFTNYANSLVFEANDTNGTLFNGVVTNVSVTRVDAQLAKVEIEITSIPDTPPSVSAGNTSLNYVIDIYEDFDNIFSSKFSRIAYRYKYKDGEYSFFSPFSSAIFSAGVFQYDPVEGYNLGMQNTIKDIIVKNLDNNLPSDVDAIDILYKEDNSSAVYLVDTLKTSDGIFSYKIETDTVKNILPENQLLRTFDNVPIKAKAQEVIGNRIIYGNYQQNYDLEYYNDITSQNETYNLVLDTKIKSNNNSTNSGLPSIKSSRDYQVGVVYSDKYGRQTPVLSSSSATNEVQLLSARQLNSFEVTINSNGHPVNAEYFKFYVKDISGDYFNLAMDRWFDAEDGNIWLSFPSSDRNKIDIDDYLLLKKGIETNTVDLTTKNKYKVIDIKNEAPRFIKANSMLISQKRHAASSPLFTAEAPFKTGNSFNVFYSKYNNSALSQIVDLFNSKSVDEEYFIRFAQTNAAAPQSSSNKYRIFNMELDNSTPQKLMFSVEGKFGSDVSQFNISQVQDHSAGVIDGVNFIILKEKIEDSARFEGRFFVKILRDEHYNQFVTSSITPTDTNINYTTSPSTTKKIYYYESVTDTRFNTVAHHGNGTANGAEIWGLNSNYDDFTDYDGLSASYPFMDDSTTYPSGQAGGDLNAFFECEKSIIEAVGDFDYDSAFTGQFGYDEKGFGTIKSWRAYFRGLNTAIDPDASSSDRVNTLHIENDRANAKFEDIWYFNSTKYSYNLPYYTGFEVSVDYPIKNSTIVHADWQTKTAVTNYANSAIINVSFGGIEPEVNTGWPDDGTNASPHYPYYDSKFFDLENHTTFKPTQEAFIKKIASGSQFRFAEDPNGEVYTITDVVVSYLINYDNLCEAENQLPPSNYNHHARQAEIIGNNFNSSVGNLVEYDSPNVPTTTPGTGNYHFRTPTFYSAPNFSVNYSMVLDKPLGWNPIGTPGSAITGGLEIELAASSGTQITQNSGLFSLRVDSITGTTPAGDTVSVEEGMVLDGHNDGGSSFVEFTIKPIVTSIDFDGTYYNLKLRCYSGDVTNGALPTGTGAGKVGDIAAADDLIFKQYYMNGMSPNSAKNLNWFRQGGESEINSGVMALGYTIEFLSVEEEESPELPSSPAIWETEPKEDKKLNVYYEASDYYKISEDPADLSSIIPVGSTVEHANSGAIPSNTIIDSIAADGTITLSNNASVQPGTIATHIEDRFN